MLELDRTVQLELERQLQRDVSILTRQLISLS